MRIKFYAPLVLCLAGSPGAVAQPAPGAQPSAPAIVERQSAEEPSESLTTERAEYTITTEVVGTGVLQLETGFQLESASGARVIHAPVPLMRIGLTRRLELRAGGDGVLWQRTGAPGTYGHASGLSDMGVELKWKLLDEHGRLPALAIAPSLSTPVGRSGFSSGGYDPTLKLAWGKGLSKGFHASGNLNVSSLTEDRRFLQRAVTLCIEHNLPHGLVGYWEDYTIWPRHRGGEQETMWNTGLFHAIGHNAQIDVEVARCLASGVPHWYLGAGFVIRRPGALRKW